MTIDRRNKKNHVVERPSRKASREDNINSAVACHGQVPRKHTHTHLINTKTYNRHYTNTVERVCPLCRV